MRPKTSVESGDGWVSLKFFYSSHNTLEAEVPSIFLEDLFLTVTEWNCSSML